MGKTQLDRFKPPSDMQGFTFVELLIVLAIFAIAVLAVAAMQITAINTNASARMSGEASALAANQVEALMALPYDDGNLALGSHEVIEGAYSVNWEVTDSDID